jgi:hypothetical protein
MLPLYAARIEDLGPGEFVKVDCATCHHLALLTPDALLRVWLSPAAKVLDLRKKGAGGGFDQVARAGPVNVPAFGGPPPAPLRAGNPASPGRSGAWLGENSRRRSSRGLGPPDRSHQARFDPTNRLSMKCQQAVD